MPAPKGNQYAVGNKGGRPRFIELEDLPAFGLEMLKWFVGQVNKGNLPFFSKFSREVVGVSEETLINYCEQDKDFFVSYKKCKEIQKEFLISLGLSGKVNPTFAIFTAKNITDMKDKQDFDISSLGQKIGVVTLPVRNNNEIPLATDIKTTRGAG